MNSLTQTSNYTILCVANDGQGASDFTYRNILLSGNSARMLSDQQGALNFRLRSSDSDYASDWHVAGDPTLLIILQGSIELSLRNGLTKEVGQGQMFIAQDYLADGVEFGEQHGHRARVLGDVQLSALHLKLSKR